MAIRREEPRMVLREDFRANFRWRQPSINRDAFRNWAARRENPILITAYDWADLRAGRPLPATKVEAFEAYITDYLRLPCPLPEQQGRVPIGRPFIDDMGGGEDPDGGEASIHSSAWELDHRRLNEWLAEYLQPARESFCRCRDDFLLAARWILLDVGRSEDPALKGEDAILNGARLLRRTPEAYADLMESAWEVNEHCVLFATMPGDGRLQRRIGLSFIVPLTESAYERFRQGCIGDMDFHPSDFQKRSRFLFFGALTENPDLDGRRQKAQRSVRQMKTIFYQGAALCVLLRHENVDPCVVSIYGSSRNERRARAKSYREVGTVTPVTGHRIIELVPPPRALPAVTRAKALFEYQAWKTAIQCYQDVVVAEDPVPSNV